MRLGRIMRVLGTLGMVFSMIIRIRVIERWTIWREREKVVGYDIEIINFIGLMRKVCWVM